MESDKLYENKPLNKRIATASIEHLYRLFAVPDNSGSVLTQLDHEIADELANFYRQDSIGSNARLADIEPRFQNAQIPEQPSFVADYTRLALDEMLTHSVRTSAPGFIGHMTAPLPYFMLALSRLMIGLNQNTVKIETAKAMTAVERQTLGMLHHMIYAQAETFYANYLHAADAALGAFCSGGTISNISALWVARNRVLPATDDFAGVAAEGMSAALKYHGYSRMVLLVSERRHYSLGKAVDTLGIGRNNLVTIATTSDYRIDLRALASRCAQLREEGACILALVGIAGTTETGHVDPLRGMAEIAEDHAAHFHVDAAWGGPALMSRQHRGLFEGIELADSVTLDAHKQLYVPLGVGMTLFKDPLALNSIQHHAEYILRAGSKDLGRYTLEGSRSGMTMLVHAALSILGRSGFEVLINDNIARAKRFAQMIDRHPEFELTTAPQLNILTFRYVPQAVQTALLDADTTRQQHINGILDQVVECLQKLQPSDGSTFVSRTRFQNHVYGGEPVSVFRVIMANPMTTDEVLQQVLDDQLELASDPQVQSLLAEIR